jgi:hypothetical protein
VPVYLDRLPLSSYVNRDQCYLYENECQDQVENTRTSTLLLSLRAEHQPPPPNIHGSVSSSKTLSLRLKLAQQYPAAPALLRTISCTTHSSWNIVHFQHPPLPTESISLVDKNTVRPPAARLSVTNTSQGPRKGTRVRPQSPKKKHPPKSTKRPDLEQHTPLPSVPTEWSPNCCPDPRDC